MDLDTSHWITKISETPGRFQSVKTLGEMLTPNFRAPLSSGPGYKINEEETPWLDTRFPRTDTRIQAVPRAASFARAITRN